MNCTRRDRQYRREALLNCGRLPRSLGQAQKLCICREHGGLINISHRSHAHTISMPQVEVLGLLQPILVCERAPPYDGGFSPEDASGRVLIDDIGSAPRQRFSSPVVALLNEEARKTEQG